MRDFLHSLRPTRLLSVAMILMLLAGVFAPFSALDESDPVGGEDVSPDYVVFDGDYLENGSIIGKSQGSYSFDGEGGFSFLRFTPQFDDSGSIDPWFRFNPKDSYSADEYKYITVVIRAKMKNQESVFNIYYATDTDKEFVGSRCVGSSYSKTDDWQIVTLDFSKKTTWTGKINSLRIDMFNQKVTGTADIAAIVLCKTPQTVYDSSFDVLTNMFPPKQIVSDFTEDEIPTLFTPSNGKEMLSSTTVNVRGGNLLFEGSGSLHDPYVGFMYKSLMKKRGVADEEILTTSDFSRTVVRYRAGNVGSTAGLELFVFTGDHDQPFQVTVGDKKRFFSTSVAYSPTAKNQWRCASIDMDPSALASAWSGDFNGFRIDWCGMSDVLGYMEISDFLFYDNDTAAAAVSGALNTLNLALPDERSVLHPFLDPVKQPNGVEMIKSTSILARLNGATGLKKSTVGQVVNVVAENDVAQPSLELDVSGIDLYKHRYVSVLIKRKGTSFQNFNLYYKSGEGEYCKNEYTVAPYADLSGWQVLTFLLNDAALEGGEISSLNLDFTGGEACAKGSGCDIGGIAFSTNVGSAYDAAYYMLSRFYIPVQVWNNFTAADAKSFGGGTTAGHTSVTADGGNLVYTATETAKDPGRQFSYTDYATAKGIPEVTTEDFRYTVMRYRSARIAESDTVMQLFLVTGDAKGIADMRRKTDPDDYHYGCTSYKGSQTWSGMMIDMAYTDDRPENNVLMRGWQGRGKLSGYRVDWCTNATEESFLQISDIILYQSKDDAKGMTDALNAVSVPIPTVAPPDDDFFPEDTESETSETVGESEDTDEELTVETETETLPEFVESDTEETLPPLDDNTDETIPEMTESGDSENNGGFPEIIESDENTETESVPEFESTEETKESVDTEESERTEESSGEESTESEESSSEGSSSESESNESSGETESQPSEDTSGAEEESTEPNSDSDLSGGGTETGGETPTESGGDESESGQVTGEGSKMPFYLACGALVVLSMASIVSVVVIKYKS